MSELKPCPMRADNGNCSPVGGFCTAVPKLYCEAVNRAYQTGYHDGATEAMRRIQPSNEPLTLEQLREMDGEPVWLDGICWGIRFFGWTVLHGDKFDWHGESYPIKGFMPSFYGNESGFHRGNKAYLRPPERSADGQA